MNSVNSVQVQSTNDASANSKCSTAKKNYINDEFIQYFVHKKHNRASLIHLGYYARAVILHKSLVNFIKVLRQKNVGKFQIISCGAGFDTTYWRLSELDLLSKTDLLVEIDFPSVIENKIKLIQQSETLKSYINDGSNESNVKRLNSNYILLGTDLSNIKNLENLLDNTHIDYECPTLFISECVITYMKVDDSDKLINWMSRKFFNSAFVNYEQIHPNDGFGTVMLRHFDKLQSPLLSVTKYPDCKSHEERYKELGFDQVIAVSEWDALRSLTTDLEHENAVTLEQFDEFEEFHSKCNHYVIAICGKNDLCDWLNYINLKKIQKIDSREILSWERIATPLEIYGHSSCLVENGSVLLFGGIGRQHRSHKIWKLFRNSVEELIVEKNKNFENLEMDMVHGNACWFKLRNESYVCLYGGRKSPNKINNDGNAVILKLNDDEFIPIVMISTDHMPILRYRSSMVCVIENENLVSFWVYGGRTSDLKIGLSDLWQLKLKMDEAKNLTYEWRSVRTNNESRPCCRMSHSAVIFDDESSMYITCGLQLNSLTVLNDIWRWSFKEMSWKEVVLKSGKLLPRYGHTSHIINNILYLIGGVNTIAEMQPGIALINLNNLSVIEYAIPSGSVSPVLFFNHTSHIIKDENDDEALMVIGGGGNCFSFGTFLNNSFQIIKLKQFFK